MLEMFSRQKLSIVNSSQLCKGLITRQRLAAGRLEKAVLDYLVVSEWLYNQVEEMLIDEDRLHVLTKYATMRGVQKISESDHNLLYGRFKILVGKAVHNTMFFDGTGFVFNSDKMG